MAPSTKYKPITTTVASLLKAKDHTSCRLYNLKDVANQLRIAVDVEGNDNISVDSDALAVKTFANKGYPDGYFFSYEQNFR